MAEPAAPRKRGRPLGSRARTLNSDDLGIHHFAFVRSWLQGLDIRWAWDRYMAFSDAIGDLRHAEYRRKEILATIIRLGHQVNLTYPPERQFTALLAILSREPIIAPTRVLPTLDEFMSLQGIDPDMYSEAELIELYQEHYPEGDGENEESGSEHVRALNYLATVLAVAPSPSDPVSRWLDAKLADKIRAAGAVDLARLVDLINVYGYRWFKRIPRLGEVRAQRIVAWIQSVEESTGLTLRESTLTSPGRQIAVAKAAGSSLVIQPQFFVTQLENLAVPAHLSGRDGAFRTNMPNTLGASNDMEALLAWLTKYQERAHTHRAYKREVERFYLWCVHALRKPLSSVNSPDCQAYRAFLAATPADWINRGQTMADGDWRPFRKQLTQSSQKHALVIVQTMFEGLRDAGYLAVNPMSAVLKGFNLPSPRVQVDRSFTDREWGHIMATANSLRKPWMRTRMLLILELLVALGLRLDELVTAKLSAIKHIEVDGEAALTITVTGKRRKQREVPLPEYVMELIHAHHRDVRQMFNINAEADLPIVCVTGKRVPRWIPGEDHPTLARGHDDAGISAGGIYTALKTFFKQAAACVSDPEIDPGRLRKGSTHWMRHTCGRQAIADDVPLEVLQQLLGHSSLSTTTIYTTTERDRMIREMRKRKQRAPLTS